MTNSEALELSRPSRWLPFTGILALHALVTIMVMAILTKLVPGLYLYCQQEGIALPDQARTVVYLSDLVCVYMLPIFFVVMIADWSLMMLMTRLPRIRDWPLSVYSQFFVVAAMMLIAYSAIWISNPIAWAVK